MKMYAEDIKSLSKEIIFSKTNKEGNLPPFAASGPIMIY